MRIAVMKPLTLVALLALGAPAWAQDTTTEDAPETTTEEAPAVAEDGNPAGLDMGEVVDTERQPGQDYVAEVFGDWELRCLYNPEGEDPCQLYQLLEDANGTPTAEITVVRLPEGQQATAGATFVAPLQTLLTQQLTIGVDGGQTKRYAFHFCTQVGCYARIGLTADEVNQYKRGAQATAVIVPAGAPDQKVELNISLTGFTAGYDALVVPVQN